MDAPSSEIWLNHTGLFPALSAAEEKLLQSFFPPLRI